MTDLATSAIDVRPTAGNEANSGRSTNPWISCRFPGFERGLRSLGRDLRLAPHHRLLAPRPAPADRSRGAVAQAGRKTHEAPSATPCGPRGDPPCQPSVRPGSQQPSGGRRREGGPGALSHRATVYDRHSSAFLLIGRLADVQDGHRAWTGQSAPASSALVRPCTGGRAPRSIVASPRP